MPPKEQARRSRSRSRSGSGSRPKSRSSSRVGEGGLRRRRSTSKSKSRSQSRSRSRSRSGSRGKTKTSPKRPKTRSRSRSESRLGKTLVKEDTSKPIVLPRSTLADHQYWFWNNPANKYLEIDEHGLLPPIPLPPEGSDISVEDWANPWCDEGFLVWLAEKPLEVLVKQFASFLMDSLPDPAHGLDESGLVDAALAFRKRVSSWSEDPACTNETDRLDPIDLEVTPTYLIYPMRRLYPLKSDRRLCANLRILKTRVTSSAPITSQMSDDLWQAVRIHADELREAGVASEMDRYVYDDDLSAVYDTDDLPIHGSNHPFIDSSTRVPYANHVCDVLQEIPLLERDDYMQMVEDLQNRNNDAIDALGTKVVLEEFETKGVALARTTYQRIRCYYSMDKMAHVFRRGNLTLYKDRIAPVVPTPFPVDQVARIRKAVALLCAFRVRLLEYKKTYGEWLLVEDPDVHGSVVTVKPLRLINGALAAAFWWLDRFRFTNTLLQTTCLPPAVD